MPHIPVSTWLTSMTWFPWIGSLLFLYLFANYLLLITGNLLLPWIIRRVYPASIHQAVGFYVAVTLVLKLDSWYWSTYL